MEYLNFPKLIDAQQTEWKDSLLNEIRQEAGRQQKTMVVLDDDPTGCQTVHDVIVLTEWNTTLLIDQLSQEPELLFILTNSRSLSPARACRLNQEIGTNLVKASQASRRNISVISRSDSTLRGHYPDEVDALASSMGLNEATHVLIPAFFEGGRYTFEDTHYVKEGDELVPAGSTPFAQDPSFGYRASLLPQWVEEKTGGRVTRDKVLMIPLDLLRTGGPEEVARLLLSDPRPVCGVNALSYRDLEVFVRGLQMAEASGKRVILRSAASVVPVTVGMERRPLLSPGELELPEGPGGLFMVGSFVPKSTSQLARLQANHDSFQIELPVESLLDDPQPVIDQACLETERELRRGYDVIISTSRILVTGIGPSDNLEIGKKISRALCRLVGKLTVRPRYLVAKGGITSSDLATCALSVRKATVLGQIQPGVPVWRLGEESRLPDLCYVVFPGNVGDADALLHLVRTLSSSNSPSNPPGEINHG